MERKKERKKCLQIPRSQSVRTLRKFPWGRPCWPQRETGSNTLRSAESPAGLCVQRPTRCASESLGFPSLILFALGARGVYILNHSLQTNQQYLPCSVKKQPQLSCFEKKSKNFPVGLSGLERLLVSSENNCQWNSELGQWGDKKRFQDSFKLQASQWISMALPWDGFKSQTWKPPISILTLTNGNGRREREHFWGTKKGLMIVTCHRR